MASYTVPHAYSRTLFSKETLWRLPSPQRRAQGVALTERRWGPPGEQSLLYTGGTLNIPLPLRRPTIQVFIKELGAGAQFLAPQAPQAPQRLWLGAED